MAPPGDGKQAATLDENAKAEVAAIVETTIGARLNDLVAKFDDLSGQAGAWRTNLESAVQTEFQKLKSEVAAASSDDTEDV